MLKNTRLLKGNARSLTFKDDFSSDTKKMQAELQPALRYVRRFDRTAHFVNDKILYRGKLYSKEDLGNMPGIQIDKACCMKGNGITLFSGELCPLSNLYSAPMVINSKLYPSNEHYYQSEKCRDHGKPGIAEEIMKEHRPREAMYIGKQVKPNQKWLQSRGEAIMRKGIEAKFQNEQLKKYLAESTGTLGEATMHPFWGIGHNMHMDSSKLIANWNGANKLGKLLQDLRKSIKEQS
jgi:ribA/ribD-fused uncharacterized protein